MDMVNATFKIGNLVFFVVTDISKRDKILSN